MSKVMLKKQLILNLPFFLIGLYATKLSEAWRLTEGADASQKIIHLSEGFSAAFQSLLPGRSELQIMRRACEDLATETNARAIAAPSDVRIDSG